MSPDPVLPYGVTGAEPPCLSGPEVFMVPGGAEDSPG